MEPDLIDRYLAELGRSLARSRGITDVLAEVEDHLRESVAHLTATGVDATTAQRLTLDRFGDLDVVARAYATTAGGLAMTTPFTRAAGTIAYVTAALWLLTGVVAGVSTLTDPDDVTWLYPASTGLAVLSILATTAVMAGMFVRSGGVGDALPGIALGLMVLAAVLMAIAPWAWFITAVPITGAAVIAARRMAAVGLARPWSDWALELSWPAGVGVVLLLEALGLGPRDYYGDYPWAFFAGFSIAVVGFAAGLLGVGARLHSEQPPALADSSQGTGVTLAG